MPEIWEPSTEGRLGEKGGKLSLPGFSILHIEEDLLCFNCFEAFYFDFFLELVILPYWTLFSDCFLDDLDLEVLASSITYAGANWDLGSGRFNISCTGGRFVYSLDIKRLCF